VQRTLTDTSKRRTMEGMSDGSGDRSFVAGGGAIPSA